MAVRLTPVILMLALVTGCELSPEVPEAGRRGYPSVITESPPRKERAERAWRRMLDVYGAPPAAPDFNPITYTPRTLGDARTGLPILGNADGERETIDLHRGARSFIDRWQELLGSDSSALSLVKSDEIDGRVRLAYRQANYPFPLIGTFGHLVLTLDEGRLVQLENSLLPVTEVPTRPAVERSAAQQMVIGRTFRYSDVAGRTQQVSITNPDEVEVKRLVVLPLLVGNEIRVHLAWEVVAGTGLWWSVYIDAVEGVELLVVQGFNT